MEIKRDNFSVEVNKPDVDFDKLKLERAEKDKLKKQKTKIIVFGALTMAAAGVSKLIKAKRKHDKKK